MITIKDDTYFHMVSIYGSQLVKIDEIDSITVLPDIIKGEPAYDIRYKIKDNLFVEDKDGEWRCTSISYQDNEERKKWQFWKPKKLCSQAIMWRIS